MQVLSTAGHVAALLLEIERARGLRTVVPSLPRDGAAPLIGSTPGMRKLRHTVERVAATDFTILIEGGTGPQAHPDVGVLLCSSAQWEGWSVAGAEGEARLSRRIAKQKRICYAERMADRTCLVTIVDVRGIRHSVEVEADSLFAAAAAALSAFRDADWTDKVGPGTTLHIEVQSPVVRHTVTIAQLRRWSEGASVSPEERLRKERLWALLSPNSVRTGS